MRISWCAGEPSILRTFEDFYDLLMGLLCRLFLAQLLSKLAPPRRQVYERRKRRCGSYAEFNSAVAAAIRAPCPFAIEVCLAQGHS